MAMDFDFSFEQQLIAKSVRSVLADLPPVMNRAPFPYTVKSLSEKLDALGLLGSGDASEPGLSFVDAVAIAIEIGRALPAGPVIEQLAASLALRHGEQGPDTDISNGGTMTMAVSGILDDGNDRVFIPFARDAEAIFAPVVRSGRTEWHIFASSALTFSPAECSDITVDGYWAKLRAGQTGKPLRGTAAPNEILQLLALAEVTGCAQIALEKTVAYISERKQFDRPIGTNQAIKHIAADAAASLEIMKAAIEYAGWTADQAHNGGEPDRQEAAMALATACSFIGEYARLVLERCTQMHGGIAFTWDYGLHRYLGRILYRTNTVIRPIDAREAIATGLIAAI